MVRRNGGVVLRIFACVTQYFENAKASWEKDPRFMMPRGLGSWLLVARPGDAHLQDGGLVYCRLCLANRSQCNLTLGYT